MSPTHAPRIFSRLLRADWNSTELMLLFEFASQGASLSAATVRGCRFGARYLSVSLVLTTPSAFVRISDAVIVLSGEITLIRTIAAVTIDSWIRSPIHYSAQVSDESSENQGRAHQIMLAQFDKLRWQLKRHITFCSRHQYVSSES